MDKVLQAIHDLKTDINTHFATKADLAEWRLEIYQETGNRIEKAVDDHQETSSGKLSKKAIAALVAAVVALSSGMTALAQLL